MAFVWIDLLLNRLEANHQPHNLRSGGLFAPLGFVPFGYSRDHVFIAGRWVVHVNTARIRAAAHRPDGQRAHASLDHVDATRSHRYA